MIQNIERRIASWSQIPESHGEPIQVLRYKPGEEYRAHYDYFFHDAGKLNNRVARRSSTDGPPRNASCITTRGRKRRMGLKGEGGRRLKRDGLMLKQNA